jgi:hypothetical protein
MGTGSNGSRVDAEKGVSVRLSGNRCKCGGCGRYFNSVHAFDRHRSGKPSERVCLDPESLGMTINSAGLWITAPLATVPAFLAKTVYASREISEKPTRTIPKLEPA